MAGYIPSSFVANLWGQAQPQGRAPYASGLAAPRPYALPQADPYGLGFAAPDRLAQWSEAQALNPNMPIAGNREAAQQAYYSQIQRQAQINAGRQQGQNAVAELKRQQWLNGTRSLADEAPGAQLTPEYYAMRDANPLPNGVRGGVAFRGGVPVGFQGQVPGIPQAVPEGGLRPDEQQAFNNALWARASKANDPYMGRMDNMAPGALASSTLASVEDDPTLTPAAVQSLGAMDPAQFNFALGANSPVRRALMAMAETGGAVAPPSPTAGMSLADRRSFQANAKRGTEARKDVEAFEKSLPAVVSLVSKENGIDVTPDQLAKEIIESKDKPTTFFGSDPIRVLLYQKFGLDEKLQLRWAQDYLKKQAKNKG